MKLNINLYSDSDNYEKSYPITILDGNIIQDTQNPLPNCPTKYVQFKSGYSPVYHHMSKGKINTRFHYSYKTTTDKIVFITHVYLYAKLNWIQRQKLNYIKKESIFHKYPIATIALIANSILGIINFFAIFNNHHSQYLHDYTGIVTQQDHILKEQSKILNKQAEILMNLTTQNIQVQKDTTKIQTIISE